MSSNKILMKAGNEKWAYFDTSIKDHYNNNLVYFWFRHHYFAGFRIVDAKILSTNNVAFFKVASSSLVDMKIEKNSILELSMVYWLPEITSCSFKIV
jgi:hypothetical protein